MTFISRNGTRALGTLTRTLTVNAPRASTSAHPVSKSIAASVQQLQFDTKPCRCFATQTRVVRQQVSTAQYTIGKLDTKTYQIVSDKAMERLSEYLEELLEDTEGLDKGYDVEYSVSSCGKSGVLTLKLGDKGTYVINKQPPNKQIWLSSPTSGPKRYDYDTNHDVWFYHRDGRRLRDLLAEELKVALGRDDIEVDLDESAER
ncbi:Mitochondrial matrix iron chaperone [Microbotryomycetes sp. JL201]|nr:Mitochondrial matrix iron chaperone [Microbotryomycetes sp. JL201]